MAHAEPLPGFASRLLAWHSRHGRHDLPWQHPRTPYRVWLSEIMLQQTQVATVVPYFLRFIEALPDLPALARAPADQVLALWSGLGYYSRARNLHAAAKVCLEHHGGDLPADLQALMALPGIGRSTAGAILAQAWGQRQAILDGNVKRVLCRSHGIDGDPASTAVQNQLWQLAEQLLPDRDLANYTQAIMDFGATVCTRHRPRCGDCVLAEDCIALASDRVDQLPTRKPGRKSLRREASWLLLVDPRDRILLERRPETGIWGGLWSLPEFPDHSALRAELALRLVDHVDEPRSLPVVKHVFTHFVLEATPWHCRVDQSATRIGDNDRERWFAAEELTSIGLPQPVRRLLSEFTRSKD